MTYDLTYSSQAKKTLDALGQGIRKAVEKKTSTLREYPKERGKKLSGNDLHSLRIGTPGGEYRAIYRVKDKQKDILIVLVAPREKVYDLLDRMDG